MKKILLQTMNDTELLANELASKIKGGMTISLNGELGAGKTTFVKVLMHKLGSKNYVTSPTFSLCNQYEINDNLKVEHWDLYRLNQAPEELYEPCAIDTVRIIEWSSRVPWITKQSEITLEFSLKVNHNNEIEREVLILLK